MLNSLDWKDFFKKLDSIKFEKFDVIVAIGQGGVIPGAFLQHKLNIPMKIIWIRYRDRMNNPMYDDARLLEAEFSLNNRKILLVDDVCRTGKTLERAKKYLSGNEIKTFVINGKADYYLFNVKECIGLPWRKCDVR